MAKKQQKRDRLAEMLAWIDRNREKEALRNSRDKNETQGTEASRQQREAAEWDARSHELFGT